MVLAMEITVLGCQGGSAPARHLPAILLDGTVLLEAGSVTTTPGLAEQPDGQHVLLSHTHLDHTGGLAYLADNRTDHRAGSVSGETLAVSSIPPVVEDLRTHFFNERPWPDFSTIPTARTRCSGSMRSGLASRARSGTVSRSSRPRSTTRCPRPASS